MSHSSTGAPTQPTPPLDALRSEGDLNLSPLRQAWARQYLDDATAALLAEDAKYFLHQSLSTPCLNVLEDCQGATLTDLQGRAILDFHGNNVHQVGFGHPKVIEAITRQLQELSFCPRRYTCEPAIDFARKLTSVAPPGLSRVLLAPGGTSAMSMAIKLARAATGRFKTISMWESFHGASLDCISVGGEAIFRRGMGPLLPGCEHVPPPDPRHCPFRCGAACHLGCADYVEYVLEHEGDVAAVIAETIRCTPFIPPPDYWRRIRQACDRHGALLILDEIPIGLGRTGKLFACEHYDVVPDMLVLGKGLGGGVFPLAALLAKESLNAAYAHGALGHFTHEKNPVACAAGLATLQIIEDEGLVAHAAELGAYALQRLRELARQFPIISDVRGLGLILGVELGVHTGQGFRPATLEAEKILYACLQRGLNFKVTMGNILTLTPPLILTRAQLDQAIAILAESLAELN
ncbi:MAG: aspartate aminotransferase family protein [Verrucomicrobiales bacterium]|nr:aspartate aminotransferase family protein [Verrucomicrobiales bacterium]